MDTVVLAVRLVLAGVFLAAAAGKLLDQPGSRRALEDFRVPAWAVGPGAMALPLMEVGVAVALLIEPSARWGAIAGLVLLLAFMLGIGLALARGETPDCHCFGQIHSAPAGAATLARNGILAALAALIAIDGPGPSITGWIEDRTGPELVAAGTSVAALAALAAAWALLTENRALRKRVASTDEELDSIPSGLPVGARAPKFALPDLAGDRLMLDELLERGRPLLLVFAHTGCGACEALLPDVGRWQVSLAERLTIYVVSSGSLEENLPFARRHGVDGMLLQHAFELMSAFQVHATPGAVVIATDGTVAHPTAIGPPAVESLVRAALEDEGSTSAPLVASPEA